MQMDCIYVSSSRTVGPRGVSGPNGKLLVSCETLPIVEFEQIGELNFDTDPTDQSTDQM